MKYSERKISQCILAFNVSVNLNTYLSAGVTIFQFKKKKTKKFILNLRTEIVLWWESKIIINFSNRQIPKSDPGTLLYLRRSALWHWKHWRKHWKVHPESPPYYILLWIIQLIRVCRSATEYLLKVNNKDSQTRHSYSQLLSEAAVQRCS